ncbi:MAG: TetR family transcriptional regulator [Nocardioides sp.]
MTTTAKAASAKATTTRQRIVDTALRLFRRDGYDRTTMRAIAAEAGVSVGNAYYYFGSKEHLVQAFYDGLQVEHAEASEAALARESGFADRLAAVLSAWLDVAAPHHEFATQFFRNAADPTSPLSPFSPESAPAREASIAIFETLVAGSDLKLAPALRRELPGLLWLVQMAVVLFWVYDTSEGQARSRLLVDRLVPIVDRLARMSRLPVVRGVVDDVVALVTELRS